MGDHRREQAAKGTLPIGTTEPAGDYWEDDPHAWLDAPPPPGALVVPTDGIELQPDDYAHLIGGHTTATAYRMPATMTWEEYCRALRLLSTLQTAVQWWLGDALVRGKRLFGEAFATAAMAATKHSPSTLQDLHYVCARIAPSRRDPELSFSHHREVANLDPAAQVKWLKHAREHGYDGQPMSREDFRRVLQAEGVGTRRAREEPLGLRLMKTAYDRANAQDHAAFLEWLPDRLTMLQQLVESAPESTLAEFDAWYTPWRARRATVPIETTATVAAGDGA